jgi:hypothetical protein
VLLIIFPLKLRIAPGAITRRRRVCPNFNPWRSAGSM